MKADTQTWIHSIIQEVLCALENYLLAFLTNQTQI